jgi:hypothetical protein
MNNPPIFELHVRPTYAVRIPQRQPRIQGFSARQIANKENLKNNQLTGILSAKASRRLSNSVNWLVASAKNKTLYDKPTGKRFSFKINFITLTLPSLDHGISDHHFKSKLLHNFINTCRTAHGLKNYVWKVETQENGNIHAHFTTDTFIHWKSLRDIWNRILIKHGCMDSYTEKHSNMTFEDYVLAYSSGSKTSIKKLRTAFEYGVATNWQSPNSTDVHAVHKVKDISAYLASYMSKKEDGRRVIKGRVWSCSTNLSEKNKLVIELLGGESAEFMSSFMNSEIKYKCIEQIDKVTGVVKSVGEIFFFHISDWGTKITGRLLEAFNEHRFKIRHALPIDNYQYISEPVSRTPTVYDLVIPQFVTNSFSQKTIIFPS